MSPVLAAALVPTRLRTFTLLATPANCPPFHWNNPLVKLSASPLPVSEPLSNRAAPKPSPVICPDHDGFWPPVMSSAAPGPTIYEALVLLPLLANDRLPLSTSTMPPTLLNAIEITDVFVPALLRSVP